MSAKAGPVRVSVRALVGFSVFPPDITPVSRSLMELGREAHLASQRGREARAERPLSWEGEAEGLKVRVSGRMDLVDMEADPPLVEELKLSPEPPPQTPLPEHRLQAVCYAFMLARRDGLPKVAIRVTYVTRQGKPTAQFDETLGENELESAFLALLLPWAAWQGRLLAHARRRDASLAALPFPYPAYRPGQREMAAQTFTAIQRRKRLFAQMPTGTGKTAAVLYPAIRALESGLNRQVFCLTARGTQAAAVAKELDNMRAGGLVLHSLYLTAKEKLCPMDEPRCHPDLCVRARGHFLRQPQAMEEALEADSWDRGFITDTADRHELCPFEFSLSLCEIADAVVCDYNYALDPQVRLSRVFDAPQGVTLLIDEAHNLADRARDMLTGTLDAARLTEARRDLGKAAGRAAPLYRAFTKLLGALTDEEIRFQPDRLLDAVGGVLDRMGDAYLPGGAKLGRDLIAFTSALRRAGETPDDYVLLHDPRKRSGGLRALCLNPAPWLAESTRRMAGVVMYSATLEPLQKMRSLLGGDADDACLSLPSPFPPENLLVLHLPLNTRYKQREASFAPAAQAIAALFLADPGKHIAYFPSFAYLRAAAAHLPADLPLLVQEPGMGDAARAAFLARFTQDDAPLLGLCVLGGVFAEGVDLPGRALIGAAVVGVGLPQVNPERELYRARMEEAMGDGFAYAYRYPGMHKVLQAAGRLIRSETDRGVLLLMDDRYGQDDYRELMPDGWRPLRLRESAGIAGAVRDFVERGVE
ncbi:MAG TPA: helicase C-terminal domain-containing protein [Candidatus Limnocylindria bacterium]|nr:helicase C-terminal domain-containing protein [Candidatus Limnocylindria bacterium]